MRRTSRDHDRPPRRPDVVRADLADLAEPRPGQRLRRPAAPPGNPLDAFFRPRSVAVIGATEKAGSVGRTVALEPDQQPVRRHGLPGQPEALQRARRSRPTRPDRRVPDPVDLAVIVTPAPSRPGLIDECAEPGVRGVIIISAGFKEIGPEGAELERQVLAEARARPACGSSARTAWA